MLTFLGFEVLYIVLKLSKKRSKIGQRVVELDVKLSLDEVRSHVKSCSSPAGGERDLSRDTRQKHLL